MFLLLQTRILVLKHNMQMNLKTTFYIVGVIILSTLTSCLGDKDEPEFILPTDATISSFSIIGDLVLPSDTGNITIKNGLNEIVFSIDQINGLIFNRDSAQYGMILPDTIRVKYTTASRLTIYNIIDGDSVPINSEKDIIDLSKPLTFRSFALNGDSKDYTFKFNIHQIDPDAFWWKKVNSDLDFSLPDETKTFIFNDIFYCFVRYKMSVHVGFQMISTDLHISSDKAVSWGDAISISLPVSSILSQMQQCGKDLFVCSDNGELYKANINDNFTSWIKIDSEYLVRNVFGAVNIEHENKSLLALAVEKGGFRVSATFDGANWSYGDTFPASFPRGDFSSLSYTRMNTGFLTIAGGTLGTWNPEGTWNPAGTTWSTKDGLRWTQIGDLPNIRGANVFFYDDRFYLLNGNDNQSIYTSINGGLTWQVSPEKVNFPAGYTSRAYASVVVDSDDVIYIIGGYNAGNPVTDIWKGRLNRLN